MKKDVFLFAYQGEYDTLNASQKDGLMYLLSRFEEDNTIMDIRHVAYMLATIKHECSGTWKPIAEYGRGNGKKYGMVDAKTGRIYYGRGYVQLTWKDNYLAMSQVCAVDLVKNPDLAMDPKYAYKIMTFGMKHGSFTGVGLSKYINDKKCDYIGARKIINGTDCAKRIAEYAIKIEGMLRLSIMDDHFKLAA